MSKPRKRFFFHLRTRNFSDTFFLGSTYRFIAFDLATKLFTFIGFRALDAFIYNCSNQVLLFQAPESVLDDLWQRAERVSKAIPRLTRDSWELRTLGVTCSRNTARDLEGERRERIGR